MATFGLYWFWKNDNARTSIRVTFAEFVNNVLVNCKNQLPK